MSPPNQFPTAAGTVLPPGFPTKNFFTALLDAQKALRGVPQDKDSQFGGKKYTSIEQMIESANGVLHPHGLLFTGARGQVVQIGETQEQAIDQATGEVKTVTRQSYAFRFTGLLAHAASGEVLHVERDQPIVTNKGRPMDLATAAADSFNLIYLLRDALMAKRGDVEIEDFSPEAMDEEPAPAPIKQPVRDTKPANVIPAPQKAGPSEEQRMLYVARLKEGRMHPDTVALLAAGESPSTMAPFDSRWLPEDPGVDELLFVGWDDAALMYDAPTSNALVAFGERDELPPPFRASLAAAVIGLIGDEQAKALRTKLGVSKERPLTGYTGRLLAWIAGSIASKVDAAAA